MLMITPYSWLMTLSTIVVTPSKETEPITETEEQVVDYGATAPNAKI